MLELVTDYFSTNCFSWRAAKKLHASASNPYSTAFYTKYNVLRKLGSGGYGTVFLVSRRTDNRQFAAKIVPAARCRRTTWCAARQTHVPDEIAIWEELSPDKNILAFVEAYMERGYWILITEYCTGYMDLFDYNVAVKEVTRKEIRSILGQVIRTCKRLLDSGVDHRDVKDENVLYNPSSGQVKLIDFGSASRVHKESPASYNHIQGTDIYIPTEYYTTGTYTSDGGIVWSIGCLAYILLNRRPPFLNRDHVRDHESLQWSEAGSQYTGELRELTEGCLQRDVSERWTLERLVELSWVTEK